MRDNGNYRVANARTQVDVFAVVCLTTAGCIADSPMGASIVPRDHVHVHVHGRVAAAGDEWIDIHCNRIDTCPLE